MSAELDLTLTQQVLCSCVGATVTSLLTTPLDVVKVRLQVQIKSQHHNHNSNNHHLWPVVNIKNVLLDKKAQLIRKVCICSHCSGLGRSFNFGTAAGVGNRIFDSGGRGGGNGFVANNLLRNSNSSSGVLSTVSRIVKTEGLKSLWSGLSPTLLMSVPGTMVYFTTYDQIKYCLGYHTPDFNTIYLPVIAGTTARVLAVITVSPLEMMRTKMQSAPLSYAQLHTALKTSLQINGPFSLFRGLGPTLLRDVPFSALYWFGYESMKIWHKESTGLQNPGFILSFISGAISGMFAAFITCPFDVVKTHRQIELGEVAHNSKKEITFTWKLLSNLYSKGKIKSLYAGLLPRLVKIAPACAIMISFYESGKEFFRNYNQSQKKLMKADEFARTFD